MVDDSDRTELRRTYSSISTSDRLRQRRRESEESKKLNSSVFAGITDS